LIAGPPPAAQPVQLSQVTPQLVTALPMAVASQPPVFNTPAALVVPAEVQNTHVQSMHAPQQAFQSTAAAPMAAFQVTTTVAPAVVAHPPASFLRQASPCRPTSEAPPGVHLQAAGVQPQAQLLLTVPVDHTCVRPPHALSGMQYVRAKPAQEAF